MKTENMNLKRCLVIQSFAPLFLLLAIKYTNKDCLRLFIKFIDALKTMGIKAVLLAVNNASFGGFVVSIISILWLLITIMISLGFRGIQEAGFISAGEHIAIEDSSNDSGATFLVTYVLEYFCAKQKENKSYGPDYEI